MIIINRGLQTELRGWEKLERSRDIIKILNVKIGITEIIITDIKLY